MLSSHFSSLLDNVAVANTHVRSHWVSSNGCPLCPWPAFGWLTVKCWTSATLLRSTWSRRHDALQILNPHIFICRSWMRLSNLFSLFSIWKKMTMVLPAKHLKAFRPLRNVTEKMRIFVPLPAKMLLPLHHNVRIMLLVLFSLQEADSRQRRKSGTFCAELNPFLPFESGQHSNHGTKLQQQQQQP